MHLCPKGKFYANHAFVHIRKILRQGCHCILKTAFYMHQWIWCKAMTTLIIHKGKSSRWWTKLMGLPLMCIIHRAYPIQVTVFQIENAWGSVQWHKSFPLYICRQSLSKQAPLTEFHPNPVLWCKFSPLCIPTREKFYTIRSQGMTVLARSSTNLEGVKFQAYSTVRGDLLFKHRVVSSPCRYVEEAVAVRGLLWYWRL